MVKLKLSNASQLFFKEYRSNRISGRQRFVPCSHDGRNFRSLLQSYLCEKQMLLEL